MLQKQATDRGNINKVHEILIDDTYHSCKDIVEGIYYLISKIKEFIILDKVKIIRFQEFFLRTIKIYSETFF